MWLNPLYTIFSNECQNEKETCEMFVRMGALSLKAFHVNEKM